MVHVLDMIHQEHLSMSRLLGLLERQVELFERGLIPDYELVREILDYFLTFPDLWHHPKENLILARLRQRAPELARGVGDLDAEHAELSNELHDFAHAVVNVLLDVEMPRDTFAKLARAFIDRERKHMAREETEFLPAARRGLSDADWAEISSRIQAFRDPVSDTAGRVRFVRLRDSRGTG
jgi:hemerythrin-like domain-containing protein